MRATSTQSNEDIQALQRGRRIPQLAQRRSQLATLPECVLSRCRSLTIRFP